MELLLGFFAGMFLTNGIPHFVSGITGNTHMSPFAKDSSALVNVLWGFINFMGGIWVLDYAQRNLLDALSLDAFSMSFLTGVLVMGLAAAWLFSNKNARFPWFK